jgi:hypothetical protein
MATLTKRDEALALRGEVLLLIGEALRDLAQRCEYEGQCEVLSAQERERSARKAALCRLVGEPGILDVEVYPADAAADDDGPRLVPFPEANEEFSS